MKIANIKSLVIPEIKVIKYAFFTDHRGYFTETYRKSDFDNIPFLNGLNFLQCNESYSKPNTIRGLHFQWNPYMGKLVRVIHGKMIDLVLDIRKNSPTIGKIIAYEMESKPEFIDNEWIWIPPGFAHGNFFTENTKIEYFCSGSYNPECETGISPFSSDIDWSFCDTNLKAIFDQIKDKALISEKDKNGQSLSEWLKKNAANNFRY